MMFLKKSFLKKAICLLVFASVAASVSAQFTLSAGYAFTTVQPEIDGWTYDVQVGSGGNIFFDWLLPINFPLSIGFEIGFDTTTGQDDNWNAVGPILARVAYHFDFIPVSKLDLYLVGKIGYALSWWTGVDSYFQGIGFGADVGVAYYFTPHFGLFAEAGYDGYFLAGTADWGFGYIESVKLPFSRFFTVGISTKF